MNMHQRATSHLPQRNQQKEATITTATAAATTKQASARAQSAQT
jgi:hypothetical protein